MVNKRKEPHERQIPSLLRIPHRAAVASIVEGLASAGYTDLRPPHMVVFQYMLPGGVRLTELAENAQVTKQLMNYLVDYLEKHGYVERVPDPSDGRAQLVRLTERGIGVNENPRATVMSLETKWADYLGKEQMDRLRQLLIDVVAMLEEHAQVVE